MKQNGDKRFEFFFVNLNAWLLLHFEDCATLHYDHSIFLFFDYIFEVSFANNFSLVGYNIVDEKSCFGHKYQFGLIFLETVIAEHFQNFRMQLDYSHEGFTSFVPINNQIDWLADLLVSEPVMDLNQKLG